MLFTILCLAYLASLVATIVGLIKPRALARGAWVPSRKLIFFGGGFVNMLLLAIIAAVAPKVLPSGQTESAANLVTDPAKAPVAAATLAEPASSTAAPMQSAADDVKPPPATDSASVTADEASRLKQVAATIKAVLKEVQTEEHELDAAIKATGGKWSKSWRSFNQGFTARIAALQEHAALTRLTLIATTVEERAKRATQMYAMHLASRAREFNMAISVGKVPDDKILKWARGEASSERKDAVAAIAALERGENDVGALDGEPAGGSPKYVPLAPEDLRTLSAKQAPKASVDGLKDQARAYAADIKAKLKADLPSIDTHLESKGLTRWLFVSVSFNEWAALRTDEKKQLLELLIRHMKTNLPGDLLSYQVTVGTPDQTFGEAEMGSSADMPTIKLP